MKVNEILYVINENRSMSIETVASMSHVLAVGLAPDIIVRSFPKKIYIVILNVSMI